MTMNERMHLVDNIEIRHVRNGNVINRRVTEPQGSDVVARLKCLGIKALKMVGLGSQYADDMIMYAGITYMAATINTDFLYVGIGEGTTVAATTQTDLITPFQVRVASVNTIVTTTWTNDTSQHSATFDITGPGAITESGLFNLSSAGTMLCRQTFAALNLINGDQLIVIWKIKVS